MDQLNATLQTWVDDLPHNDAVKISLSTFDTESFLAQLQNENGPESFCFHFDVDANPLVTN